MTLLKKKKKEYVSLLAEKVMVTLLLQIISEPKLITVNQLMYCHHSTSLSFVHKTLNALPCSDTSLSCGFDIMRTQQIKLD